MVWKEFKIAFFFFKQLWLSVNKTTDTKSIPRDYFFLIHVM